jgi:DNA-binding Lrp family transcriptional regulator
MDTLKQKILTIIEKNSRIDMKELAVLLGTGEMEILNAMQEMQDEGIICGYHTMINWDNTSSEKVSALIEVSVTPHRGLGFDKMAERIYQYDEVSSVYLMSGTFDFTVLIEGRTMKDIAYFVSDKLSPMDGIVRCATHFVLKKYKDHGTILVDTKSDERMLVSP